MSSELILEGIVTLVVLFTCLWISLCDAIPHHAIKGMLKSLLIAVLVAGIRVHAADLAGPFAAVALGGMLVVYIYLYTLAFRGDHVVSLLSLIASLVLVFPAATAAAWATSVMWRSRSVTDIVTLAPLVLSALSILIFIMIRIGKGAMLAAAATRAVAPASSASASVAHASAAQPVASAQPAAAAQAQPAAARAVAPASSASASVAHASAAQPVASAQPAAAAQAQPAAAQTSPAAAQTQPAAAQAQRSKRQPTFKEFMEWSKNHSGELMPTEMFQV